MVVCDDGSQFFVRNAVIRRWIDPDNIEWIFLISEHYEMQVHEMGCVVFCTELAQVETEEIG
jgi:hypothetical protein